MELTEFVRHKLTAIRDSHVGDEYARDGIAEMRGSKAEYNRKRARLNALVTAWRGIGVDMQVRLLAEFARQWEGKGEVPPDLESVLDDMLEAMEQPGGAAEKTPGFRRASLILWNFYWQDTGGHASISKQACADIGAELSDWFGLGVDTATNRFRGWAKEMNKHARLPRMKGDGG